MTSTSDGRPLPTPVLALAATHLDSRAGAQRAAAAVHLDGHSGNPGALLWARAHPQEQGTGCCYGDAFGGPEGCTCWTPEYDAEQHEPRPPTTAADLRAAAQPCGDCAYRRDSPERAHDPDWLLDLPGQGALFWCHEGMRRPARWRHPDGRTVDGDPDDWRPPLAGGIPYRLDGRPGLLCAGWTARAAVREGRRR